LRIAIISDLHFGIKKSNDVFLKSQLDFIEKGFVPYLKKQKITKIFILGDIFDNRNHINIKTKNKIFDLFSGKLSEFDITILLGNHDIYYNSTTDVHSLKWLSKFDNINIVEKINEIDVDGRKILLVPWQVNDTDFIKYLSDNNIESQVAFGHLSIMGFNLNKYKINSDGVNSRIMFDNFDLVLSGHFHTRSKQKRDTKEVVYIGAPYHLTRNDIDEEKGFCIFDTKNLKYEFVDNGISIQYIAIKYPQTISKKLIKGNLIDVQVLYDEKYNEEKLQEYIKKIEVMDPIGPPNIKVISNFSGSVNVDDYSVKNSYELMYEYVEKLNIDNREEIYRSLESLYHECKTDL